MEKLGDIAQAIEDRIKTKRKAPQIEQSSSYKAVRSTAPPLVVLPIKILDNLTILRDANALAVLIAIANHANKAGITHCSQERVAALVRLSRKTVGRKLKLLIEAGLIRIEYRRPYQASAKRLNVMRIIYDNGTASRQDVQAITGSPPMGQQHVPQVNGNHAKLSTGNTAEPYDDPPPTGHTESPTGNHPRAMGQVDDPPMGQIAPFTYGTDIQSPTEQAKALNKGHVEQIEYTHGDVITYWRTIARHKAQEVMPNEADHAIIEQLMQAGVPLQRIKGAIADHCLDAQEAGRPPAVRLKPAVAELLATR